MSPIAHIIDSKPAHLATGAGLSMLWLVFAAAHLANYKVTEKTSLLFFCIAETLTAAFLVVRTQPRTFTTSPRDWVIAVIGTFLPLLLRPTEADPVPLAEWGLMLGSGIQIAGVLSLNRSYALVPALREVKTTGMYRYIRHPIYFSYLITFCFYLAANFSSLNALLLCTTFALLVTRIFLEERHLGQTAEYRTYRNRVKWRLIPFVF